MKTNQGHKEDVMTSVILDLTRRKFMLVSAAAVAVPLLTDLSGLIPEDGTAAEAKEAKKSNADFDNSKCNGCQVCTIYFSNCLALNNRICWCENAGSDQSAA